MTAAAKPAAATPPSHGRKPENTPIPGGGVWRWDATAGAWVDDKTPAVIPRAQE